MKYEEGKKGLDKNRAGGAVIEPEYESELDERRWSVVSFDKREAASLTYAQASAFMAELDLRKVAGLCIVTDDAAERIKA